jgi:hypothetical protein
VVHASIVTLLARESYYICPASHAVCCKSTFSFSRKCNAGEYLTPERRAHLVALATVRPTIPVPPPPDGLPYFINGVFSPLESSIGSNLPFNLLAAVSGSRKTLKKIPHRAKGAFRDAYLAAVARCNSDTDAPTLASASVSLLLLPLCTLFIVPSVSGVGGKKRNTAQLKSVLSCLSTWNSGDAGKCMLYTKLLQSILPDTRPIPRTLTAERQQALNLRRCVSLLEDGQLGRAFRSLTSMGMRDTSDPRILSRLRDLHPQLAPPLPLDLPLCDPWVLCSGDIVKHMLSFPIGSAAGLDGFFPQYFRDMLQGLDSATRLRFAHTSAPYLQLHLNGAIPSQVSSLLSCANLHALVKGPIDGVGVRPLAIGMALPRLLSKLALSSVTPRLSEYLLGVGQLGVGIHGGVETIIHAVSTFMSYRSSLSDEAKELDPKACLQIDFTNAFNLVDRSQMLAQVREHAPTLLRWVSSMYVAPSPLFLNGSAAMTSCTGVRQGDPLGPLLFCLALAPIMRKIQDECPSLDLMTFYLDDGTFIGSREELLRALAILQTDGAAVGLSLNLSKCSLFASGSLNGVAPVDLSAFSPDIPRSVASGISLLGGAIGPSSYMESFAASVLVDIDASLSALELVDDCVVHYHLLKHCAGISRFNHVLRTSPPSSIPVAIRSFDTRLQASVEKLFGFELSDLDRSRLPLGITDAGFGIKFAAPISKAAYLGSLCLSNANTVRLLHTVPASFFTAPASPDVRLVTDVPVLPSLPPLLLDVLTSLPADSTHSIESLLQPRLKVQSVISQEMSTLASATLLTANTMEPRAYMVVQSCRTLGAGDFLRMLPLHGTPTRYGNKEFRTLCLRFLGKPVFSALEGTECVACAAKGRHGVISDCYGDHAVSCPSLLTRRHHVVRDMLRRLATQGGFSVAASEPGGLLAGVEGTARRPADVFISAWSGLQDLAVDVSIVSNLVRGASPVTFDPLSVIAVASAAKINSYAEVCSRAHLLFEPFICGVFGGFDEGALRVMEKLQEGASKVVGPTASYFSKNHVRINVSAAISKFVAFSLVEAGRGPRINVAWD